MPLLAAIRKPPRRPDPERVALLVNERSPDSLAVARHYQRARRLPSRNIIPLRCEAVEHIADDTCQEKVLGPACAYLARTGLDKTVDFLVTTRGIPLVTAGGLSVDSLLMVVNRPDLLPTAPNPYFNKDRPFARRAFGDLYLCTRLDGYTLPDAKALVNRALAARPVRGPFLFDIDPRRQRPGYAATNDQMRRATRALKRRGFRVRLDELPDFARAAEPLAGYFSWGSNDGAWDPAAYTALRFVPGALAETAVSTSARTLRSTKGGQSLIADLVAQGATGVKGYVTEPYLMAVAHADILFSHYVSGRNLAESFYAASAVLHWKDVVLGDPLCAPYATTART